VKADGGTTVIESVFETRRRKYYTPSESYAWNHLPPLTLILQWSPSVRHFSGVVALKVEVAVVSIFEALSSLILAFSSTSPSLAGEITKLASGFSREGACANGPSSTLREGAVGRTICKAAPLREGMIALACCEGEDVYTS
jgi:hypothetical protein